MEPDRWQWLSEGLRAEVGALFARGVRVPQELVGSEALAGEGRSPELAEEVPF